MLLRTTTSVLAVMALTAPAIADVTPSEVWQNWVAYYKANGYTVTEGAREEAGETLVLRDVLIAYAVPDEGTRVEFRTPEITLTQTGDGRVRTKLAETSPATASFVDADGEQVTLNGSLIARDNEVVSGGTATDMVHESRSGELTLALDTVQTSEGTREVPVTLKLVNATSRQHFVDAEMMRFDVTMATERVELAADYADPEDAEQPGRIKVASSLDGLRAVSSGAIPKGVDVSSDLPAALRQGLDITATFSAGQGRMDLDFAGQDEEGQEDTASAKSTLNGFELTVGLGADGLKYQGAVDSTATELTVSDLPAPISYVIEEGTFDVQFPVMKSDQPAPFKFAYSIAGLTLADSVWDMFDSARALPRDPAHLDLDITGMLRVTMDLFDPALMATAQGDDATEGDGTTAPQGDVAAPADGAEAGTGGDEAAAEEMPTPFEPVQVTINQFAIGALGASVDASGELSVPEGGNPDYPVGEVKARLEGINGLIDRLVTLGVIAEEEVAGYRLMLAMFARPAPEGGDALVSEFEFREGGQIFANGQQVK